LLLGTGTVANNSPQDSHRFGHDVVTPCTNMHLGHIERSSTPYRSFDPLIISGQAIHSSFVRSFGPLYRKMIAVQAPKNKKSGQIWGCVGNPDSIESNLPQSAV
jgi:hypothetical protein